MAFFTDNNCLGDTKYIGKSVVKLNSSNTRGNCILRSPADSDAFQSGRCAEHNGRPETPIIVS